MIDITFTNKPSKKDIEALTAGLAEYAKEKKDVILDVKPFGFFYKNPEEKVLAGCNGVIFYNSMFIDQLFVDPVLRHQGIGTLLVQKAESLAKTYLCSMITVNTMDWEALPFYQKLGFTIDFKRNGYANHSAMYFLKKNLNFNPSP